jgi:hypothetical protein
MQYGTYSSLRWLNKGGGGVPRMADEKNEYSTTLWSGNLKKHVPDMLRRKIPRGSRAKATEAGNREETYI